MNDKEKMPLLLAKQKDARFLREDIKLGWLMRGTEEEGWYWIVWGSSPNFENAKKIAKQILEEKGKRIVYYSEIPLLRDTICKDKLDLQDITENCH